MSNNNNKYYTILAGRKEPAKVLQGTLNKTTGLPDANAQKVAVVVGSIVVPNYSRPWARRIITGAPTVKKDDYIAVTHKEYRGELEFLAYGTPGGEEIDIRFMRQSSSLDKMYQDTIQKLQVQQEDAVLMFQQGINNFDPVTEKLKVEMLKHHGLNRDNKSRNPNNLDWDFTEYNSSAHKKDRVAAAQIANQANGYALEAKDNREKCQVLASIFRIDDKIQDEDIVDMLLEKATENPNDFIRYITDYQHRIAIMLHDGVKDEMIKITKDGKFILVADTGEKMIFTPSDIEGEGRDKIAWVVQKSIESIAVHSKLKELDTELTALRKQLV